MSCQSRPLPAPDLRRSGEGDTEGGPQTASVEPHQSGQPARARLVDRGAEGGNYRHGGLVCSGERSLQDPGRGAHHQGGGVSPGHGDQVQQSAEPGDISTMVLNHPVGTVEDLLDLLKEKPGASELKTHILSSSRY